MQNSHNLLPQDHPRNTSPWSFYDRDGNACFEMLTSHGPTVTAIKLFKDSETLDSFHVLGLKRSVQ
jgi:hypothetical protein